MDKRQMQILSKTSICICLWNATAQQNAPKNIYINPNVKLSERLKAKLILKIKLSLLNGVLNVKIKRKTYHIPTAKFTTKNSQTILKFLSIHLRVLNFDGKTAVVKKTRTINIKNKKTEITASCIGIESFK
jgi:hypothetical protein